VTTTEIRHTYWLDLTIIAVLVWGAYLLSGASAFHRYSYYQILRDVVCVGWALAAYRFYVYRWYPISVLGVLLALLFNPISPITMRKWEWQPYDHATMLLSIGAAVALAWLSYSKVRAETSA
jgi:hypothetical protein